MSGKSSVVSTDMASKVLRALGMPRAVQIVRYMHMNGWFLLQRLEASLGMDRTELMVHLAALEEAGLVPVDLPSVEAALRRAGAVPPGA